ncbi:MAG: spermidine synthase [Candidatus Binatia bacterium]
MSPWQQQNLAAITHRLAPVKRLPSGIVFNQKSLYNHIIVRKSTAQLQLCYRHEYGRVEEIESRLALKDPLSLLSDYTQAMMLALVWQPSPRRILLLGLGGGRLQMVLHHYLPDVELYTVELDQVVVDVACRFFALVPDERQHIIVQDGREYVRGTPPEAPYDVILLDAYQAEGVPPHLYTSEFYEECRRQLATDGVIVTNLHSSTSLYDSARKTFAAAFRSNVAFRLLGGNVVVLGSDNERLSLPLIRERAAAVQERYGFDFSLPTLAQREVTGAPYRSTAPILRDAYTPRGGILPSQ